MRRAHILSSVMVAAALAACGSDGTVGGDDDVGGPDGGNPGDPDGAPLPDGNGVIDAQLEEKFSFFVTSLETMRMQSGSQDGFGGDLGGVAGADAICQTAAANVGFGHKQWRAFLSATTGGPGGGPIHAIDRIGEGPWYDRNGRLVAMTKADLLMTRPNGDAATKNDLPDEFGTPLKSLGDTHDIMTGSNSQGKLESTDAATTCFDWTSTDGTILTEEKVMLGHSWPAMSGQHWISSHHMRGCAPGVNLVQNGPGFGNCVGCGGGWGGIYCFALTP
jgi:hypothetical protein